MKLPPWKSSVAIVKQETYILKYNGGPAERGEMDAYTAGAALIAFSDFIEVVAKEQYGQDTQSNSTVRALAAGSFEIEFLFQLNEAKEAFLASGATVSVPLLLKELFRIYRHLTGNRPRKVTQEGNQIAIVNDNGSTINVNIEALNVTLDGRANRAVGKFVRDALETSASNLEISTDRDSDPFESVTEAEAEYFGIPESDAPAEEMERRITLRVDSISFIEGNKWRFRDAQTGLLSFWARIADKGFVQRVNNGVTRFGKGDTIVATMRMVETQASDGSTKQRYTITQLHSHQPGPQERQLELDQPPASQRVQSADHTPTQGG